MEILYEYVRNIAVYVIFMAFAGALTPDGKYKSYVNLTLSLILVLMMVTPISGLLGSLGAEESFGGLKLLYEKSVMAGEYGYNDDAQNVLVLGAYKEALTERLVNLLSPYNGYQYVDSVFDVGEGADDFGEIKEIVLRLDETRGKNASILNGLIRIEPISIGTAAAQSPAPEDEDIKKIKKAISDFYNLTSNNIYIIVRKTD